MQLLFSRAFEEGSAEAGRRPAPDEWIDALVTLAADLTVCPGSRQHVYWRGATACPWCTVMRAVKVDLFPNVLARTPDASSSGQEHLSLAKLLEEMVFHPLELVEPSQLALASYLASRPPSRPRNPLLAAALRLVGLSVPGLKSASTLQNELRDLEQQIAEIRRIGGALTQQHKAGCQPLSQKAAGLAPKLRDIPALRLCAVERLRNKHREMALEKHLEGFLLRRFKIPGIGGTRMAALLSAGITTAADIREDTVETVPWIGPGCAAKLRAWRLECEAQFQFDSSIPLPEKLRSLVNKEVDAALEKLVSKGKTLESEYNQRVAEYSGKFNKLQQEFEILCKLRAAVQNELEAVEKT
jgi:DNA-binding helix-hairpin-helix protein with protein kinase domain